MTIIDRIIFKIRRFGSEGFSSASEVESLLGKIRVANAEAKMHEFAKGHDEGHAQGWADCLKHGLQQRDTLGRFFKKP